MQLKQYFKKRCNVSIEAALFLTKDDPIEIKSDKNKIDLLVNLKKQKWLQMLRFTVIKIKFFIGGI